MVILRMMMIEFHEVAPKNTKKQKSSLWWRLSYSDTEGAAQVFEAWMTFFCLMHLCVKFLNLEVNDLKTQKHVL